MKTIGFTLLIGGLAALGDAITMGQQILAPAAAAAAGAAILWLDHRWEERNGDVEEVDDGCAVSDAGHVDKPAESEG